MDYKKSGNKIKGNLGEDFAATALIEKGYVIIDRNYQKRCGEIDIIAQKGHCLYFAEVKTRKNNAFGNPLESITKTKRRRICLTAQAYLEEHPTNMDISFLAIGILLPKTGEPIIEIVEDNFLEII